VQDEKWMSVIVRRKKIYPGLKIAFLTQEPIGSEGKNIRSQQDIQSVVSTAGVWGK
jgi:hypothetical protein